MEEQKDMGQSVILTKVLKSLENGGSFSQKDREKFAQAARMHGIEDSVIEEMIDIGQTLSLIYRHEDLIDTSDLSREQKKAMLSELQAIYYNSWSGRSGKQDMELKKVDADILSEETNEYIKYIKEGNDLLEEAEEVIKAVASDCEFALARFE